MIKDYPKLETPFIRQKNGVMFTLTPEIAEGFHWFLTEEVDAVEKIDGTNIGIRVENGKVIEAYNRNTKIVLGAEKGFGKFFTEGIKNAKDRGWLEDGISYGELVGPNINQNRHLLRYHLWVPFSFLRENCKFESYPRSYDGLNEWFKSIPSLFNRMMGTSETLAEGVVFYRKKTGSRAKIRRDMFDWYEGRRHKEK